MSFFHIAIIKDPNKLIAEYIYRKHKLFKVMKALIKRATKPGKVSFKYKDKVVINLIKKDKFIAIGLTTIDYPIENTFQCLEEVLQIFKLDYSFINKLSV